MEIEPILERAETIEASPILVTTLTLDLPMRPEHLYAFRGAVIETVMAHQAVFEAAGLRTDYFHNHREQDQGTEPDTLEATSELFRYPLIQYKVRHRRAEIVGIGPAAKAPELWLAMVSGQLNMRGRKHTFGVYALEHQHWSPVHTDTLQTYRINQWLPLNVKNYEAWQRSPRLTDKVSLLDQALWGNVFSLLESQALNPDRENTELFVSTIDYQGYRKAYKSTLLALDVTFCTNLSLPEEIGLGQKISLGFGKVQRIQKKGNTKG